MGKQNSLKIKYLKFITGIFFCILLVTAGYTKVFAQCDPTLDPFCTGDPDAPLDGGVSLLVAAGVVYGFKKFRNRSKGEDLSI